MIENKKIKICKHSIINKVDKNLIDKYTILDFSKSRTYYKNDKLLISGFIKILENMQTFTDNITKIVFDKKKPFEPLKKNELYILFRNIFKNLMERINIIDRINIKDIISTIKNNLTSMISNINYYKQKFKDLENNTSIFLNKELDKFKNVELDFKEKTEKNFSEMLNKWEKISLEEREKKRHEVLGDHHKYLKDLETINKKIISYTNEQNDAFLSMWENISYLIEYLFKNKIINEEEKYTHENALFNEEETIEDIYRRNKKCYKVSPFTWKEFINSNILMVKKENAFNLIKEAIQYFIKDEKDSFDLLEKNKKYYLFHQILFGEKKDVKLSDLVKNDNDKNELLWFLNHKRINNKNFTEELITQLSEIFVLVLQKKCIEEKNYEIGELIFTLSSTYYYENKDRNKIYISDILKDKESFKNEEFIVNMGLYLFRKELKEKGLTNRAKDNAIDVRIIGFLGTLKLSFDKNFVMNILTEFIKGIGLNDKDKIEYYKNFVNSWY